MCTNRRGSYICSCEVGFRLASDKHGCNDIDECVEQTDDCDHTCMNIIGSYSCSCYAGYRLANDGRVCDGKTNTIIMVEY